MATRFNGVNGSYLRLSSPPPITGFTVCLRGRLQVAQSNLSTVFAYWTGGPFSYVGLTFFNGTQLRISDSAGDTFLGSALSAGDRFFCALSCAGSGSNTLTGYLARAQDSSLTSVSRAATSLGAGDLFFLFGDNLFNEPVNASIEYVVAYDSVLSPSEVAQQWRSPSPVKAAWGFYPMTGSTLADNLLDRSGNGRNLTQVGTAPTVEASPLFGGPVLSGAAAIDIGSTVARPRVALTF